MDFSGRFHGWNFSSILLAVILGLIGCAKSIAPPGGPVDRKPPELYSTTPPAGSVEVSPQTEITIDFSERLDAKSAAKAVFLTPLQDPEPRVKIKGNRIVIIPRQVLDTARTYTVVVGSEVRDAHGVNLARSVSLAFSTGEHLDSGVVSGRVFNKGKPAAGISVALFGDDPGIYGLPIDSLAPAYITQTGADGVYSLNYLPAHRFYLVAAEDKNKNHRINAARELIGLPYASIELQPERMRLTARDIAMHQTINDTTALRSVTVNPDGLIKVKWNHELDAFTAKSILSTTTIVPVSDSTKRMPVDGFSNLTPYPCTDFIILSDSLNAGQNYRLVLDLSHMFPELPDSSRTLYAEFSYPEIEDRARPMIVERVPMDKAANVDLDSSFFLRFSEPVDATSLLSAVRLTDTTGMDIALVFTPLDRFSMGFAPGKRLDYGTPYLLSMARQRVIDLHGNQLADSTETLRFMTIGKDTTGQVSGEILRADQGDMESPVVISFSPVRDGKKAQLMTPPHQDRFTVDLLPGYYQLSAFLDRNRNGTYDYGSVVPYQLAEPFCSLPDTIRVRTRFESAGIKLRF